MEILQLALQRPEMAILDETDSGLDIDALRVVANGVNAVAGPGHGRADHHPLPADPPPRAAEPRARHVPGPDRQARAARSWSTSSRPRATAGSPRRSRGRGVMSIASTDLGAVAARVPGPAPRDRRPAARLSRLGRDLADAAAGDRRDDPLLHRVAGLDPPRRVSARGRGDRPVRGRAARGSPTWLGLDARGDDLHRQRDRGDQPGRLHLGRARTCSAATSWC